MAEIVRYKYIFTGRVQGVGFRFKASQLASKFSLTGFVRNEYDGSVMMEVQGTEEEIYMYIKSLLNDRYIDVHDMQREHIPLEEHERRFGVDY